MVYNLRLMKAELMDENTGFIGVLNEEIWQRFGKNLEQKFDELGVGKS